MALVTATSVAVMAAAVLQVSAHFTRKQLREEQDTRAFYLAEAGLSEAYYAVTSGGTGSIGSSAAPVRSGDGYLWVDAVDLPDRRVRLESTACAGLGRSSLAITVERVEVPLGIFADRDITIESPVMIDGFDSSASTYEAQAKTDAKLVTYVDPLATYLSYGNPTIPGAVFKCWCKSYHMFLYEKAGRVYTHELGSHYDPTTAPVIGPHTDGGGRVASNGSISVGSNGVVYGDALPGPDGTVSITGNGQVNGSHTPRSAVTPLSEVVAPALTLQAAIEHKSAVPLVLPAGNNGFESLSVFGGAELVVQGPAVLLVNRLDVQDGGLLSIANGAGRVDLYVNDALEFAPGSEVDVESRDPSRLSLQVVRPDATVRLASTSAFYGIVYGPTAKVRVEAPFQVFGALVTGSLDLAAGVRLHFDSGLSFKDGPIALPKLLSWEVNDVPLALRANPGGAGTLDANSLLSAVQSRQMACWTLRTKYYAGLDQIEFEGPFEAFEFQTSMVFTTWELVPPDVQTTGSWMLDITYKGLLGSTRTYSGAMDSFRPAAMQGVMNYTLTPPADLVERGYETIVRTF